MNWGCRWAVLKYGGTSVAAPENWGSILETIRSVRAEGLRPLVVCSALSGVSDALEDLLAAADAGGAVEPGLDALAERHRSFAAAMDLDADEVVRDELGKIAALLAGTAGGVPPAVRAEVMAAGEMLSTRIGARWLAIHGAEVAWRDVRELLTAEAPPDGACDRQAFLSAVCGSDPDAAARRRLDETPEPVVVTQGFLARDAEGRTVLLGRGGSDVAAALLAARIRAERVEIWTDVPGIFTANPQMISDARLLSRLSYNEAEALAGLGAKVLHPRAIDPVRQAGVPLRIRWTAQPDVEGTEVSDDGGEAGRGVKAVASRGRMCLVTMVRPEEWQPVGFMADVANCFRDHALCMDLVSSSPSRIQTTLDLGAASGTEERIPALLRDLSKVCEPQIRYDVATVSLVGRGIRGTMHDFAPKLGILEDREILMLTPAANDLSISFAVPRRQEKGLVRRLHRVLFEEFELDDHFGPTWAGLEAASDLEAMRIGD